MRGFILLIVLFFPRAAPAFSIGRADSGAVIRWPIAAIPLYVSEQIAPGTSAASVQAVNDALGTWNSVACATLQLYKAGVAGSAEKNTTLFDNYQDGKNAVVWIDDSRWNMGPFVLGIAVAVLDAQSGEILEADVNLNGYDAIWATADEPTPGYGDVKSVVVHELGHFIGLQHVLGGQNQPDPPTMAPIMDTQLRTRTPNADDQKGLCYLYPASAYSCDDDGDCPQVLALSGGRERYVAYSPCSAPNCADFIATNKDSSTDAAAKGPVCLCDNTTACDKNCSCDPECKDEGCAATPLTQESFVLVLFAAALWGLRRRNFCRG